MPTLYPPAYPERPDAPLLAFGPSFSEEISRSVIAAVWLDNPEQPRETEVRFAASLTMLEAFHPRDHLECMMAAQGVASHMMIMECFSRAMKPDTTEAVAIKLRGNISQLSRTFSLELRDLERRQAKPLMERPVPRPSQEPPPQTTPPRDVPPGHNPPETSDPPDVPEELDDAALTKDLVTRPDGTPGSIAAYAPKPYVAPPYIPREPPIMRALALRPSPWRMVNTPRESPDVATPGVIAETPDRHAQGKVAQGMAAEGAIDAGAASPGGGTSDMMRGPLDLRERMFTGDALASFASARFDPDAPNVAGNSEDEESVFELELYSTGGDPEAEAERAAMIAANPEGKPIVTFRYGTKKPPAKPPDKS